MDWVRVYSGNDEVQTELVNASLHAAGIETRVLDKKDSEFVMIGQIEIYVLKEDAEKAVALLQKQEDDN